MTAPVGAVDHAAARVDAGAVTQLDASVDGSCDCLDCRLGRAYLDLDARLNALCDEMTRVLRMCDEPRAADFDDDDVPELLERIQETAADAIDAAHGGVA